MPEENQTKPTETAAAETTAEPATPVSATPEAPAAAPIDDSQKIAEQEAMAEQQKQEEAVKGEEVKPLDLRPGMTIRVFQKIKEGEKERVQIFQGIITAMRGKTPATKTITVQKQSFGVFVEKIIPLASPLIEKIEVVKIAKVRRAKLYFLQGFSKRLKEVFVKQS